VRRRRSPLSCTGPAGVTATYANMIATEVKHRRVLPVSEDCGPGFTVSFARAADDGDRSLIRYRQEVTTGQLIREARLRCGLSQRRLARRVGTRQSAISGLEADEVSPHR
jgi:hypothetical protein